MDCQLSPLGAVWGLTNYLLQSIVGTILYYGYGLGLQLKLGNLSGLVLGVAVFALQVPLSVWWLRRFQFGPVEWLWRSLTYMRVQPFLAPKLRSSEVSTLGKTIFPSCSQIHPVDNPC